MFAVDVCDLPETGGSTFVLVAGLFVLVAGVIVARWVRQSAGRLSVVVAPLVLLGGLVLAPQVTDPCAPTTTTVAATTTTTVAPTTTTVAATTTTVALTCATGGSCAVGETGPGGGIVFYDAGSIQPWGRYFEAACAGWSDGVCGGDDLTDPQLEWGCYNDGVAGAEGTAIGTGQQNTTDILNPVTGCPQAGIAAELVDDLVLGSQSDWFLPSKDDLHEMYLQQNEIGGFLGYYWSSSAYVQGDGGYAWYQSFYSDNQSDDENEDTNAVRPVRAF